MNVNERHEQLATLNELGEILNREAEFDRAVARVLERLVRLMKLSTGWVFLSNTSQGDSHEGSFELAASTGLPPALAREACRPLHKGGCDCQGLFRKGRLERGVNMVTCSRLAGADGDKGGLELHASVPLLGSSGPVGILNIAAPGPERFDRESLDFLAGVGKQLGIAFERSRLQAHRTREARYTAALEERQRLAQQMHDSLAQLLFAADLNLQTALAGDQEPGNQERGNQEPGERGYGREGPGSGSRFDRETHEQARASTDRGAGPRATTADDAKSRLAVRRAAETVRAALAELQGLVELQRSADLSLGLVPALARLAERTGSGRIRVHFDSAPLEVHGELAQGLYRIAQEAVSNALRHSAADNVWLRLRAAGGVLSLEVRDDGHGFEPRARHGGLGLAGMTERARASGGELRIECDSTGTLVCAEIPWQG